jgi:aryl-alcohol dehydrogenase-like predicted oxidoreductase
MANALEIGVTAWSPLGSGVLTGKYNRTNKAQQQQNTTLSSSNTPITKEGNSRLEGQNELANRFLNDKNIFIAQKVTKIAKR